ncbi:Histone acetyltransferase-like protein [Elsinoe fawcettii]|nr:Histone acetyltransferase-like protein [Elsinoe fawcettii]
MATLETPLSQTLYNRLAERLPLGSRFKFNHISTPPTKCDPLFAPPPGRKPERTYCESHFLTVSGSKDGRSLLLFAVEVLVFTTKRLTTIFVSKADSTGCLATLQLPKGGGASLVRSTASEMIAWLVEHRQRPRIRCMVSLFARAQGQYLFPRSVENKGKHVLDDRQLVKWWCKTLDPVLRAERTSSISQAYVIVPGFDKGETTAFFPPSWRQDPVEQRKWQFGHPLEIITSNPIVPPRCLVPRFPDDPKARYLDELDEEIPDSQGGRSTASPSKKGNGMWRTVKTLSQFWDHMAFRQECSSGRMVGFIWVVFTPPDVDTQFDDDTSSVFSGPASPSFGSFDMPPISEVMSQDSQESVRSTSRERIRRPLTGPIIPRAPKIKKVSSTLSVTSQPEESVFFRWPEFSRGQVVLEKSDYDRIHDLLLKLDFSNDDAAAQSTAKWFEEAAMIVGDAPKWGQEVIGKMEAAVVSHGIVGNGTAAQPNNLSGMIIRKKRKADDTRPVVNDVGQNSAPAVNILGAGMIRKKPKVK